MRRTFELTLPIPPSGGSQAVLKITSDADHYIPRLLQFKGLAHYERHTISCFLACALGDQDGTILDIGANAGVFSWLAAALGSQRVIAFEPFPALADTIENIAAANDLAIQVERCAIGEEVGSAELFISNKSDCSHSLNAEFRRSGESVTVALETVDAACKRLGVMPTVMKIDTETTEPAVLRGSRETLAAARPLIICEVLPGQEAELHEVLDPLEYRYYQIGPHCPLEQRPEIVGSNLEEHRNWLFAPSQPDPKIWDRMTHFSASLGDCVADSPTEEIHSPALLFAPQFREVWKPLELARFKAALVGKNASFISMLNEGERLNFYHGSQGFDLAGPASESVEVTPGKQYRIELKILERGGVCPAVRMFAFQYDSEKRIQSDRVFLQPHDHALTLNFDAATDAKSMRVAFQFTGPGVLTLGPIRMSTLS